MRALVDATIELIDAIERDAVSYHTSTQRDDERGTVIKSSFRRLGGKLLIASRMGMTSKTPQRYVKELRQSVTGSNFDSASFTTQERQGDLLLKIGQQRDMLEQALQQAFIEDYP